MSESEAEALKDMERHTRAVLQGAGGRGMDKESVRAAVKISMGIETDQALLKLLQDGKVRGWLDEQGEVVVENV
jgi:hypothetical protein